MRNQTQFYLTFAEIDRQTGAPTTTERALEDDCKYFNEDKNIQ